HTRRDSRDSPESEQAVRAAEPGERIVILNGSFTFEGPRATVWDLLQDPAVLAKALPGAKTLTQTAPDTYEGTMKVSVGPVTAAEFTVGVTLTDKVPPQS